MSLASRLLPITRRGQFFEDDFFSDVQGNYSSAIHDVLDRWGGRSLLADQFANYRKARQEEPQDDDSSLAASISETPEAYVIVLDMTDYVSGEITVRTVGYNAVVDAKVGSSKTFHRKYPLPKNTNTDAVVAAMSDEGILTINAKRKEGTAPAKKLETATSVDEAFGANLPNYVSSLKIDVGQNEEGAGGSTPSSPTATSTAASESSSTTSEAYKTLPISKHGQFFKDAYFENVWNDFDSAMESMVARQKKRQEQKQEERQKRDQARKEVIQKMIQEEQEQRQKMQAQRLERQRRASQEMQSQMKMFQSPSMMMMSSPMMDKMKSYRTLRSWAGGEDNQAATITADEKEYKVVLDVKDFVDGELDLKSDGEVLTVTGSKGKVTFKREFSLPGLAAPEQVSASLSEDGVLSITAPKK